MTTEKLKEKGSKAKKSSPKTASSKERNLRARIEKRFASHQGDEIMMALKDATTQYLMERLRKCT